MRERRRRGSIIDLLLILLAFLCVSGLVWRTQMRRDEEDMTREVLLYAVMSEVHPSVADMLSMGDAVYNAAGEYCGTLVSVRREPSRVLLVSMGAYVEGVWDMDERIDLYLELSVSATPAANGVLLHGARIATGAALPPLYTERCRLYASVYNMTPIETQ